MQTIRTNLAINASTQYTNHPFTSMCVFNGAIIGAGPTGVRKLCCGSDDNGDLISAYFIPAITNFGSSQKKHARYAYIAGTCDESLTISYLGNDAETAGPYTCTFNETGEYQERRVKLGRGLAFNYGTFRISNVLGSSFSIDAVQLYLDTNSHVSM